MTDEELEEHLELYHIKLNGIEKDINKILKLLEIKKCEHDD